jgi:hypothetical protein
MATTNQLLYTQEFTGTSINVTHNLDRDNLDVRIVCSGTSRPDLIDIIEFTNGNEKNEFVMGLTSSNVGVLQLLDNTKYPVNLPTPEIINIGSQVGFISGTTLNGDTLELNRTGGLSAFTIDLSSIDTNTFVSGGTFNTGTTSIDFVGNSPETTFSVDMGIIQHDRQVADIPTWSPTGPAAYTDIVGATLDTGNLGTNGDYIIIFNANWQGSSKNKKADFQILVDGFAVSISERGHSNHKQNEDYTISSSIMVGNVASGTPIKVQGKINGGNLSVQRGTLIIDGIRTTNNIS